MFCTAEMTSRKNLLQVQVSSFRNIQWPQEIPFLLLDENQTSSSEPLPDSRKNVITWNRFDSSGPEFGKPTLGNHRPFPINVRVWHIQGAKEGVNHYDALFHRERGGLLDDVLCVVHKTPP
jgi:hypothetical protein